MVLTMKLESSSRIAIAMVLMDLARDIFRAKDMSASQGNESVGDELVGFEWNLE